MKILIVGARGMLGSKLCQVFNDFQPTCWDKAELDITDDKAVASKIRDLHPDVIINAAAYTDVDGAETDQKTAFAINADGVKNLGHIAKDIDAIVIHYSTDYVFPGTKEGGYTEEDSPQDPVNAYGASKLAGEIALQESDARFYLIRTAWLYGENGSNFVETMLKLSAEKKELSVVNDQWGSPTYTTDVAQATRALLDEKKPLGIYHGINEGITTWFEYAQTIFAYAKVDVVVHPVSSAEFPRPAKRPAHSIMNTKDLSFRPWQKALEEYIERRTKPV